MDDQRAKRFYLTTPIYYVNARPHLGTAYTTIIADIIARFMRMQGYEVLLVTGSDENSQKIVEAAAAAGKEPLAFCDEMVKEYHQVWHELGISSYEYVRTTEERHRKLVQHFFSRIHERGDIYKGSYAGHYCTPCETFYTEKELLEGGLCPKCQRPTHEVSEEAYFFRLSKYQEYLEKELSATDFVIPEFRRNEMLSRVREGLQDVCISRSSLKWGIPLPWDEGHVFYVWVDALLAYLTGSGYDFARPDKECYWPAQLNLMAKDIPWFHAVIFPAMLKSYGLPRVEQMLVHGYWLYGTGKMSKSRGQTITPREVIGLVGADGLRYFYAREVPLGLDGSISLEAIVNRYNYDLGNDLGNLLNRVLTMTQKYFGGVVPEVAEYRDSDLELREAVQASLRGALELYGREEGYQLSRALEEVFAAVRRCNQFVDTRKPWVLGKQADKLPEFAGAFCVLLDAIRAFAIVLAPVIPHAAQAIWEQIGLSGRVEECAMEDAFGEYPRGGRIGEAKPIFPRVELAAPPEPAAEPQPEVEKPRKKEAEMPENVIEFNDFMKVEIIAAKVLSAEKVEGADKLIKMKVDDGAGGRQMVAGIAPWYAPEELVGKCLPIVANLRPAKIRGELSEGMLLAAQDDAGNLALVLLDRDIAPGSRVK